MNKQEVAGVLAYFTAAFPNMEITHDTADVWANELADIDPDLAPTAMRNVVKESEFPPTIAKFREACAIVAHHQRMQESTTLALEPAGTGVVPHELIADLRTYLASADPKKNLTPDPEAVVLPKSRCSRCGQMTMPYTWTLEPKDVDPLQPYSEDEPA